MYMMSPIKRFFGWYFSKATLPYWCILTLDSLCVLVPGMVCFYFRNGGDGFSANFWPMFYGLLITVGLFVVAFRLFHTYTGVLRYSSFVDLKRLFFATFTGSALTLALYFALSKHSLGIIIPDPLDILMILIVSTILMWGIRVIVKSIYETTTRLGSAEPVFIYGCMTGGVGLAKSIRNSRDSKYSLAGFVSGDPDLDGSWLLGVKVYYDTDKVVGIMVNEGVKALLVSPVQNERFRKRDTLIDALIKAEIKIMMMPVAEEWDGKSDLSHAQLKEVEIEDLLPREKIEVDMAKIGSCTAGKKILITGAAGSIGSEMARQIAALGPSDLILVDQAETPMHDMRMYMSRAYPQLNARTIVGSITNRQQMEAIFAEYRPDYVLHAAAYKHVPMMEDNPGMAVQNNIFGTRVIADLAVKYGVQKFVMISTDKAVNPTNVMGCSKRICEIYCQALNKAIADGNCTVETVPGVVPCTQFITTRFGNVLGSSGSVIPIFREQIKRGGPVTVTHKDIIRYFMLIPEACRLVLEAATMGNGGEIFVFDMGEPVRIADLAQRMIDLSGAKDVEIVYTGIRDGEKLYEEVLNYAEKTRPTVHPKILVASVREYPYDLALKNEQALYELSFSYDAGAIVKKMAEIVPEYKSTNPHYQSL